MGIGKPRTSTAVGRLVLIVLVVPELEIAQEVAEPELPIDPAVVPELETAQAAGRSWPAVVPESPRRRSWSCQ